MDLVDHSGEIRATVFTDLVDKYYETIEVDKVYYISKCQLKNANKQFSSLNNDYEMTFVQTTIVEECYDDTGSIPTTKFNFVPISSISSMETNALVDVLGICKEIGDVVMINTKSGKQLNKRELTLVDSSQSSVCLTLWGQDAENFNHPEAPVIAVKGARVNEFGGGKSISQGIGSLMKINPDIHTGSRKDSWLV